MDFWKALRELHSERQRLTRTIAWLESLESEGQERRGRKSMPVAERQEVSERMKVYWSAKRQQQGPPRRASGRSSE